MARLLNQAGPTAETSILAAFGAIRMAPDFDALLTGVTTFFARHFGSDGFCLWLADECAPTQPLAGLVSGFDCAGPFAGQLSQPSTSPVFPITAFSHPDLPFADATTVLPLLALGTCLGALLLREPIPKNELVALTQVAQILAFASHAHVAQTQLQRQSRIQSSSADELKIAETIQRSLLPTDLPAIAGWSMAAHYEPARVIGGDLYDFIPLPNDLLGIVLGDASDKGTPAALMMATARTLLRSAAQRLIMPARVLAQVNDDLSTQIPPGMFVTCFFGLLDTTSGRFRYANAGHCAPVVHGPDGTSTLTARGWPLGMLPGKTYDEGEIMLLPGQSLVLYSDGLSESMDSSGQLFGTDRVQTIISGAEDGRATIRSLIAARIQFTAQIEAQDDDITMVSLSRDPLPLDTDLMTLAPRPIDDFSTPSSGDNERAAADRVLDAVRDLNLTQTQRDRLHTAVAEAVMNAAEHGNHFRPDLVVQIIATANADELVVQIIDAGKSGVIAEPHQPNLEAKLAGEQSPRGWGLFLISKMVDRFAIQQRPNGNCVELGMRLGQDVGSNQRKEQEASNG